MLSIWEKSSLINYHHIIIGGGIVGLTTAYYLKKKFPHDDILILERGLLPSGASTKNAGFACMGSLTEILDDLNHDSEEQILNLFMLRKMGLERLQNILSQNEIGYKANGSYELIFESDKHYLDKLHYCNALLKKQLNTNAFEECTNKLQQFGFAGVHSLIENKCEGEIDTGLMMKNLTRLVLSLGIEIKTGCKVTLFEEGNNHTSVVCTNPIYDNTFTFLTQYLYICNNAFANELLHTLDLAPGRGQVLFTKPVNGLKFKGIFHFNQGYYYFREYNGCVLLGGGRNLDKNAETTFEFGTHEGILKNLNEKLSTIILPSQPYEIEMNWSGIMAFGKQKQPIVKPLSERTFIGVRMGGMGVAIGSEVGFRLSEMVNKN